MRFMVRVVTWGSGRGGSGGNHGVRPEEERNRGLHRRVDMPWRFDQSAVSDG